MKLKALIVLGTMVGSLLTGAGVSSAAPVAATAVAARAVTAACNVPASGGYYDRFNINKNFPVVGLAKWVPQGMGLWPNWSGSTDAVLIAYYLPGSQRTRVVAYWADGSRYGSQIGYAELNTNGHAHGSGIGVTGSFLMVGSGGESGNGGYILTYAKADLKKQITAKSKSTVKSKATTHVNQGASFMDFDGGGDNLLYAGNVTTTKTLKGKPIYGHMYGYRVSSTGKVSSPITSRYTVPPQTQGLVVTAGHFVFSSSWGTAKSTVTVRNRKTGKQNFITAPCRAEGLAQQGNKLYLVYESASTFYVKKDKMAHTEGKWVHTASLSALFKAVD